MSHSQFFANHHQRKPNQVSSWPLSGSRQEGIVEIQTRTPNLIKGTGLHQDRGPGGKQVCRQLGQCAELGTVGFFHQADALRNPHLLLKSTHATAELTRLAWRCRSHDPVGDSLIAKQHGLGVHEVLFRAAKSACAGFERRRRPRCQAARRQRTAPVRETQEARPRAVRNGPRKRLDGERHRVYRPSRTHLRDSICGMAHTGFREIASA